MAVCLAAVLAGSVVYWQHRNRAAKLHPLSEVLWITDRDLSTYYAPGTRESQAIARTFVSRDPSFAERRFDSFILYRQGLTATDSGSEPLLVLGFDPSSIPANRKKSPQ
jgi:hypothetical protein